MPDRISVIEQYNNRDLIAQIYRIISLTESSTIVRVTTTQEGSHVTVTLEMYDGTSKTFTFDCVGDVTTDTVQNINALKNFMMGIGVVGPTHIDGDVRIVNGHYLQLAGDLDVGGDTELAGDLVVHGQSEISGMSIEESSGKTVLSNDLGISTPSPFEVPTTITGARDTYAANGTRLQNDLDNYLQMLRTSGAQTKVGLLTLLSGLTLGSLTQLTSILAAYGETGRGTRKFNIIGQGDNKNITPASPKTYPYYAWSDENNAVVGGLRVVHNANGTYSLQLTLINTDGSEKYIVLGSSDVVQ